MSTCHLLLLQELRTCLGSTGRNGARLGRAGVAGGQCQSLRQTDVAGEVQFLLLNRLARHECISSKGVLTTTSCVTAVVP